MGKLNCIVIDCADAKTAADFWVQALEGYVVDAQEWGVTLKSETAPLIYFEVVPEGKAVKNRLHLNMRAAHGRRTCSGWWASARPPSRRSRPEGLRLDEHEGCRGTSSACQKHEWRTRHGCDVRQLHCE
jgi:hypothetical protein